MTIGNTLNNLQLNLAKISAQEKIDPSKDTADQMTYDSLNSDMMTSQQNILNLNDSVGYAQVADGVLSGISDQTNQLNTLSVASNNGALNSDQKSMINSQMQDISNSINQTLSQTTFNGNNVFSGELNSGSSSVDLSMNTDNLDISNQQSILDFQKSIDSKRSDIGSFMNSANASVDNLTSQVVNEANSKSNYEVDLAQTVNQIDKDKLNLNAGLIAQSHNTDALANSVNQLLG